MLVRIRGRQLHRIEAAGGRQAAQIDRSDIQPTDALVVVVGNKHVPECIPRHAVGCVERSIRRKALVATVASHTASRHGPDHPVAQLHLADAVVVGIGYVEPPHPVQGHAVGLVQGGIGGRTAITRIAKHAGSRHGRHDTVGIHPPDFVVVLVRHIQIPRSIKHDIRRIAQACTGGGRPITGIARQTTAGHRGDDLVGERKPADAVVVAVRDVQMRPRLIQRQPGGEVQRGIGGHPALTAEAGQAGARDGADGATGIHLADAMVIAVRDVEVALGILHAIGREPELRVGRRPAIAQASGQPRTRDRLDVAVRRDPPDAVVVLIGHVHIPVAGQAHIRRTVHGVVGGEGPLAVVGAHPGTRHRMHHPLVHVGLQSKQVGERAAEIHRPRVGVMGHQAVTVRHATDRVGHRLRAPDGRRIHHEGIGHRRGGQVVGIARAGGHDANRTHPLEAEVGAAADRGMATRHGKGRRIAAVRNGGRQAEPVAERLIPDDREDDGLRRFLDGQRGRVVTLPIGLRNQTRHDIHARVDRWIGHPVVGDLHHQPRRRGHIGRRFCRAVIGVFQVAQGDRGRRLLNGQHEGLVVGGDAIRRPQRHGEYAGFLGDALQQAGGKADPPDALVVDVGKQYPARRIHIDPGWRIEHGGKRRSVVAAVAVVPVARDGANGAVGLHQAQARVLGVGNKHPAQVIHRHPARVVEQRIRGRPAVASEPVLAGPRERRNDTVGRHRADAVVVAVGDQHAPVRGHRHRRGIEQRGLGCGPAVAAVAKVTVARQGMDVTERIHHPHPGIELVGDVQAAIVHAHRGGTRQQGVGSGATVSAIARRARARNGADDSVRVHPAHHVRAEIRDVEVAAIVQRNTHGPIQGRIGGRAAVTAVAGRSVARHGLHDPVGIHPAHSMIVVVCEIEDPVGTGFHPSSKAQRCVGGRPAVAREPNLPMARQRLDEIKIGQGQPRRQVRRPVAHGQRVDYFGGIHAMVQRVAVATPRSGLAHPHHRADPEGLRDRCRREPVAVAALARHDGYLAAASIGGVRRTEEGRQLHRPDGGGKGHRQAARCGRSHQRRHIGDDLLARVVELDGLGRLGHGQPHHVGLRRIRGGGRLDRHRGRVGARVEAGHIRRMGEQGLAADGGRTAARQHAQPVRGTRAVGNAVGPVTHAGSTVGHDQHLVRRIRGVQIGGSKNRRVGGKFDHAAAGEAKDHRAVLRYRPGGPDTVGPATERRGAAHLGVNEVAAVREHLE